MRAFVRPIVYLCQNRLSQFGVAVTTTSTITLFSLYLTEFFGVRVGPYAGIIAFFLLPALFIIGLIIIPIGMSLRYISQRAKGGLPVTYPKVDFHDEKMREMF